MILIPYRRKQPAKAIIIYDDEDYPVAERYQDKCPVCGAEVIMERTADCWTVDEDTKVITPEWNGWGCHCDACGHDCTIPYDDGTARTWDVDDEDDDWNEWGGYYQDDVDEVYDDEDDGYYACSCSYCHCVNQTIGGAVCNECLSGAHQG